MSTIKKINAVLLVIVAVLLVLCVASVYAPVRFEKQCAAREGQVKQRLVLIRAAAESYRSDHGAYAGSLNALVDSGYMADSLRYIPYSGGRHFKMEASSVTTRSGKSVPVMECSAAYADYLRGLDANSVHNITVEAEASGRFAGLKFGNLDAPGDNSGNWE